VTAAALSCSRTGRAILHVACLLRRPRTIRFQFAGIQREVLEPLAAIRNRGPLLPLTVAIAVALMAWWSLR
jgi:hypothetical protein